jgi:hypothetical protein
LISNIRERLVYYVLLIINDFIFVDDLNETPSFGQSAYTFPISYANALVPGSVVGTIAATDPDSSALFGSLTYSFTDASDLEYFNIVDPNIGVITVRKALPLSLAGLCRTSCTFVTLFFFSKRR